MQPKEDPWISCYLYNFEIAISRVDLVAPHDWRFWESWICNINRIAKFVPLPSRGRPVFLSKMTFVKNMKFSR